MTDDQNLARVIVNLDPLSMAALDRMASLETMKLGGRNRSELVNHAIQRLDLLVYRTTLPPLEVVLAAVDHALRTPGYAPDAYVAFDKLCNRVGVNPEGLVYERGWAKKYLT